MNFKTLPKIDLHHHFDGAFNINDLYSEAIRRGLPQGKLSLSDFTNKAVLDPSCRSLTEFLATFDFFYDIAQDLEFLEQAAYNLARDVKKDNLIYLETRFAPHLFSNDKHNADDVVAKVLQGLNQGSIESGVPVKLIICIMRGMPVEKVEELITLYEKYHHLGLVGIDMAGDESRYDGLEYVDAYKKADDANIPITIHAGESSNAQAVWVAIDKFKARRIGHGIKSIEDDHLMKVLVDRNICLEVCLTSNVQTGNAPSIEGHAVTKLLKHKVPFVINTDDPSVSGIDLTHEWQLAHQAYGWGTKEVQVIMNRSIEHAFCDLALKNDLQKTFNIDFASWAQPMC